MYNIISLKNEGSLYEGMSLLLLQPGRNRRVWGLDSDVELFESGLQCLLIAREIGRNGIMEQQ